MMCAMRVILFCFAGREANMRLQLPYVRRILAENPDVEYHVWNLSRNVNDDAYLRFITGERIIVHHELYGPDPWRRFDDVYRYYARPEFADTLFVKIDDDVVFIETDKFVKFVNLVAAQPHSVVSAQVVNNGACTPLEPGLHRLFSQMGIPLLDVHLHSRFAMASHRYFFDHADEMFDRPVQLVPIHEDWLSINLIGYTSAVAQRIGRDLGAPSPTFIAGRTFSVRGKLGDEGLVNTLPRLVARGFTACHLTFGPQEKYLSGADLDVLRQGYAEISEKYLGR